MPKAAKKSNCVTYTSENELQEDSNLSQESSSEDEVVIQNLQYILAIHTVKCTSNATDVCAIYRRAKYGLDCE